MPFRPENLNAFPTGKPEQLFVLVQPFCFGSVVPAIPATLATVFPVKTNPFRSSGVAGLPHKALAPWLLQVSQFIRCEGWRGWVISQGGRHLQIKGSSDTMNCWKRRTFYFLPWYCDSVKLLLLVFFYRYHHTLTSLFEMENICGKRNQIRSSGPTLTNIWGSELFIAAPPSMAPVSLTHLFGTFCRCIMVGETNEPWQKTKVSYFPLYWLVNRDPYNALL